MSIVVAATTTTAAAAAATQPSRAEQLAALLLIASWPVAIALIWFLGIHRPRAINRGPVRIARDRPLTKIFVATVIAASIWFLCQVGFAATKASRFHETHPNETFSIESLDADDIAFLATVPGCIALVALILLDGMTGEDLSRRIGYALRRIPAGVAMGALATIVVLPIMWTGQVLLEIVYRLIHFEHPNEHELLNAMKTAPQHVRTTLIVGATFVAPVFEEFLFRGHLQTILVRLFTPKPRIVVPLAPPIVEGVEAAPAPPSISPAVPLPLDLQNSIATVDPPPAWSRWLAVLIASILFASVHPLWMAPAIFILSVCLGYAYERTGNLWVPVTIHAIFNISSTLIFLNTR